MLNYKVLLTTSGTGSRLGNMTQFTNKSLVRVGKKPSISYIVESYPIDVEIVVTLGHYGQHVRDFLELAYPDRKFTFVEIDKYEGQGSSLLYSMNCAKDNLQCPFVFHACDTITSSIQAPLTNWMAGHKTGDSSQYRSFNVNGSMVTSLNEKGEQNSDYYYMGICGIKDYIDFWAKTSNILEKFPDDQSLSDCHVLREMIKEEIFTYKQMETWLDIGNINSLKIARDSVKDKFHVLDKDEESIFIFDNFVIKFFYDSIINENRIKRAFILNDKVPKIIGQKKNFYKYEFEEGELLSRVITPQKMQELIEWTKDNLWLNKEKENFHDICKNFYIEKTKNRVKSFLSKNNIKDGYDTINNVKTPSIFEMIKLAENILLNNIKPTGFHGDFILDNMLVKNDKFTLLDWRQDFGGDIEAGDFYYDIAKLNHNLVLNHDILIKNMYIIDISETIECDVLRNHKLVECQNMLTKISKNLGFNIDKINVLTAIIWINMAPLHEHKLGLFLYYFGKYNLFKALKEAGQI